MSVRRIKFFGLWVVPPILQLKHFYFNSLKKTIHSMIGTRLVLFLKL